MLYERILAISEVAQQQQLQRGSVHATPKPMPDQAASWCLSPAETLTQDLPGRHSIAMTAHAQRHGQPNAHSEEACESLQQPMTGADIPYSRSPPLHQHNVEHSSRFRDSPLHVSISKRARLSNTPLSGPNETVSRSQQDGRHQRHAIRPMAASIKVPRHSSLGETGEYHIGTQLDYSALDGSDSDPDGSRLSSPIDINQGRHDNMLQSGTSSGDSRSDEASCYHDGAADASLCIEEQQGMPLMDFVSDKDEDAGLHHAGHGNWYSR